MKNYDFVLIFIVASISCFIGQYYDQHDINTTKVTASLFIGLIVTLFVYYINCKNITKR